MVKVLNVISDTNIGGAGRVLLNYLKYSDRSSYNTAVCLPTGSLLASPLKEAGADVFELGLTPDKSFARQDIAVLRRFIKSHDFDIVHTHGSLSGRIAGRQCGKIVIYTRHCVFPVGRVLSTAPGRFLSKLMNKCYSDRIIAISPAARENLLESGVTATPIDVIMNGVEPLIRKSGGECAAIREKYRLSANDFVLGILARIEEYKGHLIILDALKTLRDAGRPVVLLIAGLGTFENEVRAYAEKLGLTDSVRFLGFISDVSEVLSVLDVQLNASFGTETSSLSLLEGMSIGLPAVVSDYGGNPFVIDEGVNGLLFKNKDSATLAAAVVRLMDEPGLLDTMRRDAVDVYKARFTGNIFAANIERIYQKALEEKKNGK